MSNQQLTVTQDVALARIEQERMIEEAWNYIASGNINSLKPAERAKLYISLCESLGLDVRMRPFIIVENGLYITKASCEWYAAQHHITRDVTRPQIITEDGAKMIYIEATGTMAGRTERDYYYKLIARGDKFPPLDVQLRRAISAAKRRVTLPFISAKVPTHGVWTEDDVEEARERGEKGFQEIPVDLSAATKIVVPETAIPAPTTPAQQPPTVDKPKPQQPDARAKIAEWVNAHGFSQDVFTHVLNQSAYESYKREPENLLKELEGHGQIVKALVFRQFLTDHPSVNPDTNKETGETFNSVFAATLREFDYTGNTVRQQMDCWMQHREAAEACFFTKLDEAGFVGHVVDIEAQPA